MRPSTRRWLGAIAAFLAVAVAALISGDATLVRGGYLAMELIGWCVAVSESFARFTVKYVGRVMLKYLKIRGPMRGRSPFYAWLHRVNRDDEHRNRLRY